MKRYWNLYHKTNRTCLKMNFGVLSQSPIISSTRYHMKFTYLYINNVHAHFIYLIIISMTIFSIILLTNDYIMYIIMLNIYMKTSWYHKNVIELSWLSNISSCLQITNSCRSHKKNLNIMIIAF